MASTKFKKRDLNRYRKIYPYLRRQPKWTYCSDKESLIEIGSVTFSNVSSGSHTFSETFSSVPAITVVAYDIHGNSTADVNVFLTTITTTGFTVESSQAFTGEVEFHAIWIGS